MSDLYLILHRVRGAPALDIASRCDEMGTPDDPGPWWIIPTSGHRAYPLRQVELYELAEFYEDEISWAYSAEMDSPFPPSWPDHYAPSTIEKLTTKASSGASSLLASLGLSGPTFKRRKIP